MSCHPSVLSARSASAAVLAVLLLGTSSCGDDRRSGSGGLGPEAPTLKTGDGTEYLAHEVVIRPAPGVSEQVFRDTLSAIGARVLDERGPMAELGYRRVELPSTTTADLAISHLASSRTVETAERSYLVHSFATADDPRLPELWGLAKVGASDAWDVTTGAREVVVAVSDTGVDATHPELAANVFVNAAEIAGNGIDDDGNGFVDDVSGWDFANNDAAPADDHGHGTHVAGTIGAIGGNGAGVAGVAWRVRLLPVKFLGANGTGSLWNGAQTILYAAKMKARVVNASWGCVGAGCTASYLNDAIAQLSQAGGLFVAAAGNGATDNDVVPSYPANSPGPNVVAVAATDQNDALASFSNWGATRVHLGAPGVGILSTAPNAGYRTMSGTSMAAPHVSGAAALYFALRPDAKPEEVRAKLLETVDPAPALAGKTVSGGRLSLARLVRQPSGAPAAPQDFRLRSGERRDVTLSWKANTETDLAGYRLRWGTAPGSYTETQTLGPTETETHVSGLAAGATYYFVIYAVSTSGLVSPASPELSLRASDTVAPPQVVDLSVSNLPGRQASGEVVASSGEYSSYWGAALAHDGSPDTAWISAGRLESDEEHVTVGLFTPYMVDAVELTPNAVYPQFFPIDFDVELSTDGESFASVGGMRNVAARVTDTFRIVFPPTLASHVRVRVLSSKLHDSGLHYASLSEIVIHEASSAAEALQLTFTAPGDDPGQGRAARYDIRRSRDLITEATFAAATPVPPRVPSAAGVMERLEVSPLEGETTYNFALKAVDPAGNVSPMSNVARGTTLVIPPSTITDLRAEEQSGKVHPGMITLVWTAPGGDGMSGRAARYDLRLSQTPLTPGDFDRATPVTGLPVPAEAGALERFVVDHLYLGRTYYFAVRAVDSHGVPGGISNIVWAVPTNGNDKTPPAQVTTLNARLSLASVKVAATVAATSDGEQATRPAEQMLDGDPSTSWVSAPGGANEASWVVLDTGSVQPLVRFRAIPGTLDVVPSYPQDFDIETSIDKVTWSTAVSVHGMVGELGAWNEWATANVTYARYVRLMVHKRGLASGGRALAAVGELEVYALTPGIDADLTWVAPGDDGFDGTAARYDLRWSLAPITEATFSAGRVTQTLPPLRGGLIEVLRMADLPPESTIYFALKAVDADGNWSPISNLAMLRTTALPPAPVIDLAVVDASKSSLTVAFTAPGGNGSAGQAAEYDLRYARSPLTAASWDEARRFVTQPPRSAGERESFVVTGLESGTIYYFAVKALDRAGTLSAISNVASGATLDGQPPRAITDLRATPVDPATRPPLPLTIVEHSGSYSPEMGPESLLDGREDTVWMGPPRDPERPELVSIEFDAGGLHRLGRLRMRATEAYRELFPVDFRVEVKERLEAEWRVIVRERGYETPGGWDEWLLGAQPAVRLRLVITRGTPWSGQAYSALADLEVYEDVVDYTTVRLSWTAPGDDGDRGVAGAYDLRRAALPIDAGSFPAATAIAGVPAPRPVGSLERFDVRELSAETTYCFAIQSSDSDGNGSPLSNSPCATTPGLPPGTITDLEVASATAGSAILTFTAPGADGYQGRAARYELRRAQSRITSSNWNEAVQVDGLAAPAPAGTKELVTVGGLLGLRRYYFAIRAIDDAGNVGGRSNNAVVETLDDVAPSRVVDLTATANRDESGSLIVNWTAPADKGTGNAGYDLRVSTAPITTDNFLHAAPVPAPAPQLPGAPEEVVVRGLDREALYYVALVTIDKAGNPSLMSNVASSYTRDEVPAPITDLVVTGATGRGANSGTLDIAWTATGDDGTSGTATRYEIRYATAPITWTTWEQATLSAPGLVPSTAGTREQYTIGGLQPRVKYYVAIKAFDDLGNASPLSNVATMTTPDETPPATVLDLAAETGTTPGTLRVSLTPPGDDDETGRAQAYELRWSRSPIDDASFAAATAVATPAPGTPGVRQSFTVSGLPHETQLYLRVRTRDAAGNWSSLSNQANAWTMMVAPARIADLRQIGVAPGGVTLGWTAPGDDGTAGTAVEYDLRYATVPLDEATFAAATRAPLTPPGGAGTRESGSVTGLEANKTYYFAIKTKDDMDNWSPLSNVAAVSSEDTVAPGAIQLAAETGPSAGTVVLRWVATGDDDAKGTATRYEIRRSLSPITAETWDLALPVSNAPAPRAAGSNETFTVTNLEGERLHHFVLRAVDEAGNAGPISNDAAADTLPIPPAAVTNLAAAPLVQGGKPAAVLTWTAPGEDGSQGQATEYDVRYSTAPLTAANFATAMRVPAPVPANVGTAERLVVENLLESTRYYFALKTADDLHAWSAISNIATLTSSDLRAPAAPASFQVTPPDSKGKQIVPVEVFASSVLAPWWDETKAIDSDATTSWASAGSDCSCTCQSLTLDLGAKTSVEQVRLAADPEFLELFPRAFDIQVSADNKTWTTVASETGFRADGPEKMAWGFPATQARYVRLWISETIESFGRHYALVSEIEVFAPGPPDGQAQVTWIAPGDDGFAGTAARYELFRGTAPFSAENLGDATLVSDLPSPATGGLIQRVVVTGLAGESTYYWGLRAFDEAGNAGPMSPVVQARTNDVSPGQVRDLTGVALGQTEIELRWTAPGEDGAVGRATAYEMRYSTGTVHSARFSGLTEVTGLPAPADAGTAQTVRVSGLRPGVTYRFSLRARDEAENVSFLSNVAVVKTESPPDVTPPAAVTDLVASLPPPGERVPARSTSRSSEQAPELVADAVRDGDRSTFWASAARAASQEEWVRVQYATAVQADRVRVWPVDTYLDLFAPSFEVRVSPNGLAWKTVASRTEYVAMPGQPVEVTFDAQPVRYVELRATALAAHSSGLYYAVVADIELYSVQQPAGSFLLSWTAPSDDGPTGGVWSYDVEWTDCNGTLSQQSLATPPPSRPGAPERVWATATQSGLACFRVRSVDNAGNVSAFSNLAQVTIP